jgi:hypothetical protein
MAMVCGVLDAVRETIVVGIRGAVAWVAATSS